MEIKGSTKQSRQLLEEYTYGALSDCYEMLEYMMQDNDYASRYGDYWEEYANSNWNISEVKETKAAKRIGCAHCSVNNAMFDLPYNATITISNQIADNKHNDKLYNTLMHEIFHVVANQLAGKPQGHSGLWIELVNYYNNNWKAPNDMPITAKYTETDVFSKEEIEERNSKKKKRIYAIHCPKCGNIWRYKIMCEAVKHPDHYRCTKCKVSLVSGEK